MAIQEAEVVNAGNTGLMTLECDSPQEMAVKLANMKQMLSLTQKFFKEIMVKDQDYGVIEGTDKPTLYKPGAEKLAEFYGYAPTVSHVEEEKEVSTGFYRARVTVSLIHRRTGTIVAEGVGEANTMEGRYRYRWIPEWKLPKGVDKSALQYKEKKNKKGETYLVYRLENEDPWTLWNTVLKMAKKRALVDATLSATRSSGLFTQDVEDLQGWIDAEVIQEEPRTQPPQQTQHQSNKPANGTMSTEAQQKALHAIAKQKGIDLKECLTLYNVESTKDLTKAQASELIDSLQKLQPAGE